MDFQQELERIADQYRREGYSVVLSPRGDQVPAFVGGAELDLIATRGEEKVIVEVKPSRSDLERNGGSARLVELTNRQPGWRFDLIILEADNPMRRAVAQALEPSDEQFNALLDRARRANELDLRDMGLVSAWAGLEAAMRRLCDDAELYGRTTPGGLLSELYSNGLLSRAEYERAREAWAIRTQAVHGFVPPPVEPALIDDIIALARKVRGAEENQATPA